MTSIIKTINKKTGVTYVYESESYWDKEKKQPRSRRKLIGRLDDETGEIIPTGKKSNKIAELTNILEAASSDWELEELCRKQAEQLAKNREEIVALKKQVMDLTLSVNEYRRRFSKIEELTKF